MQTVEKVRELSLNDQIFSADSRPSTIAISSHYALAYARFNYKSLTLLLLFQITSVIKSLSVSGIISKIVYMEKSGWLYE